MTSDCLPALLRRLFAAALLLLAIGAAAQPARGFLWEARRGEAVLLLLGTIHVGRDGEGTIPPAHRQRIEAAQAIAVEADVFDAQRTLAAFQRFAFHPPEGPPPSARLPAPLRARVDKLLPRYGLPVEAAARLKPWALANNLVVLEATRLGYSPAGATEAQLFALAQAAGKPIVEIESVEKQLALFDAAPPAVQLDYLEQVVAGIESGEGEREIRALLAAWRSGDTDDMARRLEKMRGSTRPGERWLGEHLFDRRHDAMVAAVEELAASGRRHVIAVGTMHYLGPDGLIARLRARGWTIERLP